MVTIRRSDRAITEDDVTRALDAARMANLPPDRELVDLVPRHFTVDGQEEIASPVGMLGQRLEVTATVITGSKSAIQNLTHCVERAGISIDALVPQALAAGEAVLTPAERDLGVTLIDIGGGTTDVGVFAEGSLLYATVLPVGGQQISNDIAVRLRTPYSAAEEIKLRHGQAFANGREEDRLIDVSSFDTDESSPVSVRMLCDTIEDRLVDTFELIGKRLNRAGFDSSLPAGTVLVGGTAQLHGIRRLAAEVLESPARIGTPSGILGLGEQLNSPSFAASVGLLRWGLRHGDEAGSGFGSSALSGALSSITKWLRSFLP
jgi:cell division protein FtsA